MPRKKQGQLSAPLGPLARHGGWSWAHGHEIAKRHPEIQLYLKVIRRDLIRDLCPEGEAHLPTAKAILVSRLMQKLATTRIIETYLAEHGLLRRDKLEKDKILEGEPILTHWLALQTQIRKDLLALGLERRALDVTPLSPDEMLLAAHADVVAQEAAKDGQGGDGDA